MSRPYINTPQTNDVSRFTNGLDRLGELSPEKSFFGPTHKGDLVSEMQKVRKNGMNLKTPRLVSRDALRLLPNGNQGKSEFTPLMKSVAKTNMARRISTRRAGVPDTPAHLRNSYTGGDTPGLPKMDGHSQLHGENTSSSAGNAPDYTPMPQHATSSAQSTPLAQLPTRDNAGVMNDGNVMTLREQENIIDKIEKENFGLKMKIHFLEEAMSKRGGDFNQAALKENTDLKVNRITMQRELHKFKKNIAQAERDAEIYRLQLEEYKERVRKRQVDETAQIQLANLMAEVETKTAELRGVRTKYDTVQQDHSAEIARLRDEIEDLQAELREKDRSTEDKEDAIDDFKIKLSKESTIKAELEDEIEALKQQVEDLRQDLDDAKGSMQEAKDDKEEAMMEKRKAEADLEELQDEMANKSFTTKGLSRQLEEKANKMEDDLVKLQEEHQKLQSDHEGKLRQLKELQDRLRELEKEGTSDLRNLQQQLDITSQQRDTFERKHNVMADHVDSLKRDLQIKSEEKALLQTRHDALTVESSQLQNDLSQARQNIQELENSVEEERQTSVQHEHDLRIHQKQEIDMLNEQIDALHREMNSKDNENAGLVEELASQKRKLEAEAARAEEKATGLQRTVEKLQTAQGTIFGNESKMQEAITSEKQRHEQEEKVLAKQIQELNDDLAAKRGLAETTRIELNNAKEELRISIREQAALKEKVAELEEEIEVLQADIEQEHQFAEQMQKSSVADADAQIIKAKKDKQHLQEQLAASNIELQNVKRSLKSAELDREELEAKLAQSQKSADDTFNLDQEKRELKRSKQKLEKDLERVKIERDGLADNYKNLEEDFNAEVERANAEEIRLNAELDAVRNKQIGAGDVRDRELVAAKSKISRLESRISDLEVQLLDQSKLVVAPEEDLSGLRHDLAESRQKETAAVKRETDLKSSNRALKIQVNDLERDLHEARLAQFKARSPSSSPASSVAATKELAELRQQLLEAQVELKKLQSENRQLARATTQSTPKPVQDTRIAANIGIGSYGSPMSGRKTGEEDKVMRNLRSELKRAQRELEEARDAAIEINRQDKHISQLKAEIQTLKDARNETQDLSVRLAIRDGEARNMKSQLQRLRDERSQANKKADEIETELEALQSKYEKMLEKLTSGRTNKGEVRDKEIKTLIREIMWLKARCRREERLREDLAWSKRYLEQGEAMRAQCNQVDLRIMREMGVNVDSAQFKRRLSPIQKFRAGVFVVVAAIRMSNMEEQWRRAKDMSGKSKQQAAPAKGLQMVASRVREV